MEGLGQADHPWTTAKTSLVLGRLAPVISVVPMVAAIVALIAGLGRGYSIISDMATEELHLRELGHYPVQVGPFSRFGWYHPGPAIYYLNWPVYQLTGHASQTFAITALLVNGACVLGIALVVRRFLGNASMIWTLLVLAVYVRTLGGSFLRDGWNPYLPVLPFALFTVLVWAWVQGSAWSLPIAALLASFAVQSHVGYAPPVAVVGGLAVVARAAVLIRSRRRGAEPGGPAGAPAADETPLGPGPLDAGPPAARGGPALATLEHPPRVASARPGRRTPRAVGPAGGPLRFVPLVLAVLGVAVMWLPPLLEQLHGHPGNLTVLVRYFRSSHGEWSYGQGVRQLSNAVGSLPAYVTGQAPAHVFPYPPQIPTWAGIVAGLAGVAALALAVRVRAWAVAGLLVLAAVVGAVGIVSVHQVVGPLFDYLVKWLVAAGLLLWIGVGCAVVAAFRRHATQTDRADRPHVPDQPEARADIPADRARRLVPQAALAVATVALLALSALNTVAATRADASQMDPDHAVRPLALAIQNWMRPHPHDIVRIDFAPTTRPVLVGTPFVGAGLMLAAQKEGLDVRAIPFWRVPFGAHLTSDQDRVKWVVVLAFNDGSSPPPGPGQRVIASAGEYQLYAGPAIPGQ